MLVLSRTRDKVAIVGSSTPHRDYAPFDDPEWEVWGINDAWRWMPEGSATRWFEMHSPDVYEWSLRRAEGHLDYLKRFPGQVYLHERREDVPRSVTYPLDEVVRLVGGAAYFTSSIAYMQGLALLLGFTTIGLWGVDMQRDSEYGDQRECCEFLLGVAMGRGVNIVKPEGSPLLSAPLYGRGYLDDGAERISHSQMERRILLLGQRAEQLRVARHQTVAARMKIVGSIEAVYKLIAELPHNATALNLRLAELSEQLLAVNETWRAQTSDSDKLKGMREELAYWVQKTPEGMTANVPIRAVDMVPSMGAPPSPPCASA